MTARVTPFEMADPAERAAFAERLNAAFADLVDQQHGPDSISRAAASTGRTVLLGDDMPGPATHDPTTPRPASSDHPAITAPITIEKDSLQ